MHTSNGQIWLLQDWLPVTPAPIPPPTLTCSGPPAGGLLLALPGCAPGRGPVQSARPPRHQPCWLPQPRRWCFPPATSTVTGPPSCLAAVSACNVLGCSTPSLCSARTSVLSCRGGAECVVGESLAEASFQGESYASQGVEMTAHKLHSSHRSQPNSGNRVRRPPSGLKKGHGGGRHRQHGGAGSFRKECAPIERRVGRFSALQAAAARRSPQGSRVSPASLSSGPQEPSKERPGGSRSSWRITAPPKHG